MRLTALVAAAAVALSFHSARAEEVVYEYDGRKLVADATLAEGKTWADGAVLMLHGSMAHKDEPTILALREELNARGYNTLSMNLSLGIDERRGMRECDVPHGHYHRQALVEIGIWLGWLREQGTRKVALLGHSRGANQVAWYAFERPKVELVGPVVLVAPTTWDKDREAERYKARFGTDFEDTLKAAQDMIKWTRAREPMPEQVGFLDCDNATVSAQAFFEYYGNDQRRDTPSLLRGVDRQVLVVAGTEDVEAPDLIRKVRHGRKMRHVELQELEGAGHSFDERQAAEAAELIADFLARRMTPGKG